MHKRCASDSLLVEYSMRSVPEQRNRKTNPRPLRRQIYLQLGKL